MGKSIMAIHPKGFLDEVAEFRSDRLKIISDNKPITLEVGPRAVLHLVPIEAFDPTHTVDLDAIDQPLRPLFIGGAVRFNFDGMLTFAEGINSIRSYVQIFHNGVIEAVYVFKNSNDKKTIPSTALERNLIEATGSYLRAQQALAVKPPIACLLTLLDVEGFWLAVGETGLGCTQNPIDRDILLFPVKLFESFDVRVDQELRQIFNRLWNAAGFRACVHYDEQERWSDD